MESSGLHSLPSGYSIIQNASLAGTSGEYRCRVVPVDAPRVDRHLLDLQIGLGWPALAADREHHRHAPARSRGNVANRPIPVVRIDDAKAPLLVVEELRPRFLGVALHRASDVGEDNVLAVHRADEGTHRCGSLLLSPATRAGRRASCANHAVRCAQSKTITVRPGRCDWQTKPGTNTREGLL